ncbi:MAG: GMC family oxidoreductase [Solirubrobacteraceae bacterium]
MSEQVDVLIVGAGASGGVVAKRLASAGISVVCLEQGHWHELDEFPAPRPEYELLARKQWGHSPNDRALPQDYPVEESESDIATLMFNGVGGSLILYAGDWSRLHPSDFCVHTQDGVADDWPITYEDLRPYYEQTDYEFGASGLDGDPAYPPPFVPPFPPLPIGKAGLKIARAHTKLGWHWWPGTNSVLSVPSEGRRACAQWAACLHGCPEGAKASTDHTHWGHAIKDGATLITGARVSKITTAADGRVTGADYVTLDGDERHLDAGVVVLAANAIGTARLLLLSDGPAHPDGLANASGLVGKRLMVHPFANVLGLFDEPLHSWYGHVGSKIVCYEFYESDDSRDFVRGAKWSLAPTGGPINNALPTRAGQAIWGADHHLHMREYLGRGASWGIFGEDLPDETNRVTLDPVLTDSSGIPAPKVTYRVGDNSRRCLDFQIARAKESLVEAGAYKIEEERLMRYSGWHLIGTAKMGSDPATSVVDGWGRSHEVDNLYIVDGSTFPTSGGVNPTSTIAAFAARAADHLIADRRDQRTAA